MDEELLQKIEELAYLMMTPQQIGDLLDLNGDQVSMLSNRFCPIGKMYRKVLVQQARELHRQTLKLAQVGSPTATDEANKYLRDALIAIDY